jgi:hypothetical protein
MAKMSQTLKEAIQIVVFLIVVGALVLVFVVYPLGRAKQFTARENVDDYNADSILANDISAFADLPATLDTFRVDTDGLTTLACAFLTPLADSTLSDKTSLPLGLAVLLHDERLDRASMIPLAQKLLENDLAVCIYDQRASGASSGTYHSDGEYEAADLGELIAYLGIRDRIYHPCVIVGAAAGADAALMEVVDEPRIDAVVAINPYITSERWLDRLIAEHEMYWIPLRHTLLKFWYELRSGYAPVYRDIDNIKFTHRPALLLVDEPDLTDPVLVTYLAGSGDAGVRLSALPTDEADRYELITRFVLAQQPDSAENR